MTTTAANTLTETLATRVHKLIRDRDRWRKEAIQQRRRADLWKQRCRALGYGRHE